MCKMYIVGDAPKQYGQVITKCSKIWGSFLDTLMKVTMSHDPLDRMITYWIHQVGQIQLIRRQIMQELNRNCKCDSKLLASSMQALNQ